MMQGVGLRNAAVTPLDKSEADRPQRLFRGADNGGMAPPVSEELHLSRGKVFALLVARFAFENEGQARPTDQKIKRFSDERHAAPGSPESRDDGRL